MSDKRNQQPRKRGPMGGMGRGMQPGEKPKNLKKSIKQLAQYIGKYKNCDFCRYALCRMFDRVQRCGTKNPRKSNNGIVRGTDGKNQRDRQH